MKLLRVRPVLGNSVAVIALRGGNLAARLLVLFAIARALPPAEFGVLVFAMSVVEIGKVVADFGMDTIAIRAWAAGDEDPARLAGALAVAKAGLGVFVVAGLAVYFAFFGAPAGRDAGLVLAASVFTSLLLNFSLDWFQARLRVADVLVPVLATNGVLSLAAALMVPRLPDLRAQAAMFPLIETAVGLVLFAFWRREPAARGAGFDAARLTVLVRASLPVALTSILIMVVARLDVLVLSRRLDAAAVGLYGMAFRITEPFQIAAAALGLSVFSHFAARFAPASAAPVRAAAVRYSAATFGYGLAAAFALGVVAPLVVERAFPAYASGLPVLRVLAASLVFRSLNATLAGILQGAGRFAWITGLAVWNLILVAALLLVFVDRVGVVGAALALLVAEGLNSLLHGLLVARVVAAHERTIAHARG